MAQRGEQPVELKIKHGHTDTHVVVIFGRNIETLGLTPAEADTFIEALQNSKKMLAEHQAKKATKQ